MLQTFKNGQGSIVLRVKLLNSSVATGAGLTGLTSGSTGLIISTIADNEATATTYTVAGSTIETITTLGTFAAPTATKCRFKEVDATNHKGVYEIQIADARFAVSSAKSLLVSLSGATNLAEQDFVIQLQSLDPFDAVRAGLTALPNVASGSAGALLVDGTGTAAISNSSGKVLLQATQSGVTIPTVTTVTNQLTAAAIATGVWTDTTAGDFTTALSVGKSVMNGVSLGTGLTIASVSGAVGSVTGAVGSVTGAVGSVTGNVGGSVASLTTNNDKTGYALSATGSAALTEGYPADGATGTLPQLLYLMLAFLQEKNVAGTTITTKKLDGATTAATYTLDSATSPTTITRAT